MAFTAKDVAALRAKTGCGMMDCKKALTESNGDMDKAVDVLREKGLAKAAKKAGRVAAEGVAFACTNNEENIGVVIEVNAETDFVAKNAEFQKFVQTCANTIIEKDPCDVEALKATVDSESGKTIADLLQEKIVTIGENIQIRRFKRIEGMVSTYVHAGGRIGVMVKFEADEKVKAEPKFKEFAKDAAVNPGFLNEASVPAEVIEHEKKILTEQVINEGKPANIAEKIVNGKMAKFYKENCLVDQIFVKDNDLTVDKYTKKIAKELNTDIKIVEFVRFEKGEGIEKREDNFAKEVQDMIK